MIGTRRTNKNHQNPDKSSQISQSDITLCLFNDVIFVRIHKDYLVICIKSHRYVYRMPISANHYNATILTSELTRCLETNDATWKLCLQTALFYNRTFVYLQCTGEDRGIYYENTYWNGEQCELWAMQGECAANPGYMLTRCWAACTGRDGPTHCIDTYVYHITHLEWRIQDLP